MFDTYSNVPKYFFLCLFFYSRNSLLPGRTDRDVFSCKCVCFLGMLRCERVSRCPGSECVTWGPVEMQPCRCEVRPILSLNTTLCAAVNLWVSSELLCTRIEGQEGGEILTGVLGFKSCWDFALMCNDA